MAWSSRSLLHVRDGQRRLHQPAPFPTWSRGLPDLMEAPPAACALHCQRRVTRRRAVVEPSSRQLRCLLPILPTPSFRVAKKCPTPAFLVAKKCSTPAFLVAKKCSFPVVLLDTTLSRRPSQNLLYHHPVPPRSSGQPPDMECQCPPKGRREETASMEPGTGQGQ